MHEHRFSEAEPVRWNFIAAILGYARVEVEQQSVMMVGIPALPRYALTKQMKVHCPG